MEKPGKIQGSKDPPCPAALLLRCSPGTGHCRRKGAAGAGGDSLFFWGGDSLFGLQEGAAFFDFSKSGISFVQVLSREGISAGGGWAG